jgi:predicted nucleotide-binding protein (sugar kinase/HSP70/actin superfamily)
VEAAFFLAWDWFLQRKADLKDMFLDQIGTVNDISVVLIGRPYLILHPALNKGIPEKLSAMGIQSFYMDMIPVDEKKLDVALDFIHWNHWYYGDQIIKTTETIARTKGLFPIYLTAFRCAPDSFIIEYFKEIMDYYRKPYLILQLDEHEAAEGYDTRLEAAVETFRNFKGSNKRSHKPIMKFKNSFKDKIYLLPGYDLLSARLIQSVFTNAGIKSLIIEQTPEIINRSLQINNGQCLPVSILTQGIEYTISKNSLNPEKVAFFSNTQTELSCNLPQYPVMIKQVLEKMGQSLGKVDILVTKFIPLDLPLDVVYGIAMAYMLAGLMQKIVHKIRPLEMIPGEIDECCRLALDKLIECFLKGRSKEEAFKAVVDDFLKIDLKSDSLPKVGIVGDLYVRDNDTFNQNLVGHIEKSGAEVVTVPFIDTLNLVVEMHFKNQWQDGRYINLLKDKVAFNIIQVFNRKFKLIIKPIIPHSFNGLRHDPAYYLKKHFLTIKHIGETSENLLKVYYLKENYPDLRLIINVNPIFCCPGLISEAIYKKVEKEIGIPIISITYDGTKTDKNKVLNPYLYFLK